MEAEKVEVDNLEIIIQNGHIVSLRLKLQELTLTRISLTKMTYSHSFTRKILSIVFL